MEDLPILYLIILISIPLFLMYLETVFKTKKKEYFNYALVRTKTKRIVKVFSLEEILKYTGLSKETLDCLVDNKSIYKGYYIIIKIKRYEVL